MVSDFYNVKFDICYFVLQKPGGPVLPGKPHGLFLNLFLRGLISNAVLASLGTRWGFRHLKPVLRPYFTH